MSANSILSRLENQIPEFSRFDDRDFFNDESYKENLSALIAESLSKGHDVMHMPSGDLVITTVQTVPYVYHWDEKNLCFERNKSGSRMKRRKPRGRKPGAPTPGQVQYQKSEERVLEDA